jgi:hypothetical protein
MLKLLFYPVLNFEPGTLNGLFTPGSAPGVTEIFLCVSLPTRAWLSKLPVSQRPSGHREKSGLPLTTAL